MATVGVGGTAVSVGVSVLVGGIVGGGGVKVGGVVDTSITGIIVDVGAAASEEVKLQDVQVAANTSRNIHRIAFCMVVIISEIACLE